MSLVGFPLLLIPLAIINIIVFLMPGVSFGDPLLTLTLVSGASWKVSFADALLALCVVLMLFEVLKASRPHGRYFTDHLLSLVAFAAAVAEFLLLRPFAMSVMFLLAVMMAVDFVAGLALHLRRPAAVRRTAPVAPPVPAARVEPPLDAAAPLPAATPPVAAPAAPSAAMAPAETPAAVPPLAPPSPANDPVR
jgi:hypothetical protein